MRADDDVAYVAFKLRVTAPDGAVAELDGRIPEDRLKRTVIDFVRTVSAAGAESWEFASDQTR